MNQTIPTTTQTTTQTTAQATAQAIAQIIARAPEVNTSILATACLAVKIAKLATIILANVTLAHQALAKL